jgi:hypothetical protein
MIIYKRYAYFQLLHLIYVHYRVPLRARLTLTLSFLILDLFLEHED